MTRKELKKIWEDELADVPWELVKRVQFHEKVNDDPEKLVEFVRLITKNNTTLQ